MLKHILGPSISTLKTRLNIHNNDKNNKRCLEIGPGKNRITGFETLNIVDGNEVDYVLDGAGKMPFKNNTFDLIYASHILEHIPWYKTSDTLCEWVRILKPTGSLEIWVPDALKICKAMVDAETTGESNIPLDGWYKFNPDRDPCLWAAGRMFTYGDGTGNPVHPNWHRALFTPRYLRSLFEQSGLTQIRELDISEVRGYNHGWINLGIAGTKE